MPALSISSSSHSSKSDARQVFRKQVQGDPEFLERTFPDSRTAQRLALDEPRQALCEAGARRPRKHDFGRWYDGRPRQRLGADDKSRPRLDQWLVQHLDLLVGDRGFQQRILDGNGRRRHCPIGPPPSPLEYRINPRHHRTA